MKKFKDLKVGDHIYSESDQKIYKYEITEKSKVYFKVKLSSWSFDVPVTVNMDEYQDGDLFSCIEALLNFINRLKY